MLARPGAFLTTFALGAVAGALSLAVATRTPPPSDCPDPRVAARAEIRVAEADIEGRAPEASDEAPAPTANADAAAQAEAEARIARAEAAEAAEAEARRAVQREAEARAASERQRTHDALQQTALRLASDVQAWTLKPAAFGGGAGSLAGLDFHDLGRPVDAQGRYQTVDGLFSLTIDGARATIRGTHRQFGDLTTTAVVEVTDRGTTLVVDGRDYGGAQVR